MKPVTVRSDPISIDVDCHGNVTLSRTDVAMTIQLSLTEWEWLMRVADVIGLVHAPFTENPTNGR